MTDITWPPELPQVLRFEGLSAQRKSSVIRTTMDAGPAKQRQRYTVATKEFTGSVILTAGQRAILEDWYRHVIGGGVLRFMMQDPQTLKSGEFRFLEDYTETAVDGLWEVQLKLEKLNA